MKEFMLNNPGTTAVVIIVVAWLICGALESIFSKRK
jgi:hypothetical protein